VAYTLRRTLQVSVVLPLLLAAAAAARASDGRVELNHARATAGGITPGDTPGYPVTLSASGSYVLTGNLTPPASTGGLVVTAPDVSVDLNGFAVRGPFTCAPGNCPSDPTGDPYGVSATQDGFTLTDGTVAGFGSDCVFALGVARVQRVQARDCAQNGIFVDERSLVLDALVDRTATDGIDFRGTEGGIARGNVVGDVAVRAAGNRSIRRGVATRGNHCAEGDCSPRGARRYYLTSAVSTTFAAATSCEAGFHMASAFELLDPTDLEYETAFGASEADAGSGPVSTLEGRVRTGGGPSSTLNCIAWASQSDTHTGMHLVLQAPAGWDDAGGALAPWRVEILRPCNLPARVWCVED
jgi:hypothetical protein